MLARKVRQQRPRHRRPSRGEGRRGNCGLKTLVDAQTQLSHVSGAARGSKALPGMWRKATRLVGLAQSPKCSLAPLERSASFAPEADRASGEAPTALAKSQAVVATAGGRPTGGSIPPDLQRRCQCVVQYGK